MSGYICISHMYYVCKRALKGNLTNLRKPIHFVQERSTQMSPNDHEY